MIRPQAMNVSKKNKLTTIIRPCFKWKVYFFFQAIRYLLEESGHFVKPVLFLEKKNSMEIGRFSLKFSKKLSKSKVAYSDFFL